MAQRIPTTAADPAGPAAKFIERHGIEAYRRDYNRGWSYSLRDGGDRGLEPADHDGRSGSDAWMDGYLDAANRDDDKWHLLRCPAHHNNPGGCGLA